MLRTYVFITIVAFVIHAASSFRGRARFKEKKCEEVTIPFCAEVGYNLTYMPNTFGHKTQYDAGLIIHQFWPLVTKNCSPLLKHFLCSLYAPMCDPVFNKEILPCRELCLDVRSSCEPIMKGYGFEWPEHLECTKYPTREMNNICMKPESTSPTKPTGGNPITKTKHVIDTKKVDIKPVVPNVPHIPTIYEEIPPVPWKEGGGCGCLCKAPFVYPNRSISGGDEIPPCVLPCKSYFFNKNETKFITFWLGLWSVIAFVASLITSITFLVGRSKFDYTERPIILIAFCYVFVSLGYIVRLIHGHEAIACNASTNLIRYSTTGPAQCTAVFILTYFFTNVAWIWWVVLAMNWFLSTGLKWSQEAISCYSQYFHFIAWLIPTVQTMAILAMAVVDGDPVSGLCSVGNHDNNALTIFIIAPLLIYSMLALSFFVAGVLAVCHSKRIIVNIELQHEKKPVNKYISKIGLYTFILLVPAISLIACHFYEHNNRELWEKSRNCQCMKEKTEPNYYVFLAKYFMSLWIGLVTGIWILETRTVDIWRAFLKRFLTSKPVCHNIDGSSTSSENNNLLAEHQKYHNNLSHQQLQQLAHQQQRQIELSRQSVQLYNHNQQNKYHAPVAL